MYTPAKRVKLPSLDEVLQRVRDTPEQCIDFETSGLDWKINHVVGYVITFSPNPADTFYLPFRHTGGGNYEGPQSIPSGTSDWDGSLHPAEEHLLKLLGRPTTKKLGHSLAFDLKFGARMGMAIEGEFEDTIINAALIDEYQGHYSLDFCARVNGVQAKKTTIYKYIAENIPEAKGQEKNSMGFFYLLAGDDFVAYDYAAGDGTTTMQLRDRQRVTLAEQGLLKVHGVESRLIPVLARMMVRGIKVDEEQIYEVKKAIATRKAKALELLPDDFNVRAPVQIRKLLEEKGITNWPRTAPSKHFPKGQPSFNEKFLLTNEIGRSIVAVRKYENLENSFITPMLERHLFKGRVHCEFNQLRADDYGTVTGRLSSSNPNMQQIPKRNMELGPLFRSIFIPDDGMVWESGDYSQCEPRLLAYYSRAKALVEGYRATPFIDAHTAVANAAGIDREDGKRLNQALITGSGYKSAAEQMGKSYDDAKPIIDKYFAGLPEIKPLQKRASVTMERRGFVLSLLERRARLVDRNDSYKALNRLLQCGNADILKLKVVEVDDLYRSSDVPIDLLNNVHDALDSQREESEKAKKVYAEALRIMASFGPDDLITLDIPMVIDAFSGPNWSIATYKSKGIGRMHGTK